MFGRRPLTDMLVPTFEVSFTSNSRYYRGHWVTFQSF